MALNLTHLLYNPKQFSQEAFEEMSRNIAASAAIHNDRRNNQQDEDVLDEREEDVE